jgi:hypothetical protein
LIFFFIAYKGAQYLFHIIEDNRLVPTASKELINVYNGLDLNKNEIIDEQRIHNIGKKFGLIILENDVKRARNQILEKIRKENQEKNPNNNRVDDVVRNDGNNNTSENQIFNDKIIRDNKRT